MIYVGYPCIGKSSIAGEDNFIDLESSNFKQYNNWVEVYVNTAIQLSNQGYNVFLSTHKDVRNELKKKDEPYIAVFPDLSLEKEWLNKLSFRYLKTPSEKNAAALSRWTHFKEDISDLKKEQYHVIIQDPYADLKLLLQDAPIIHRGKYDDPRDALLD